MGAKTKAATDAVKSLNTARMQAIADLTAILNAMTPLEATYKAKTQAYDVGADPIKKKLGIFGMQNDPVYRKLVDEQGAAWSALDDKWLEVKKWVDTHASAYAGMDAALKTLKDKISKKKVLDFFKTQKSLPDAKLIYEAGLQANKLFQEVLTQSAADFREWRK